MSFTLHISEVPDRIYQDHLSSVFPGVSGLNTVILMQANPLVYTEESEVEKEAMAERFIQFARELEDLMREEGDIEQVFDFVDPATGVMIKADNFNMPYFEAIGVEGILKFKSRFLGSCRVFEHPEFGYKMYPASIFTTYSIDKLNEKLKSHSFFNKKD